jgi:hypothetical protein
VPARLLAPSLGAINACCAIEEGSPYLQPNQFAASASYRWLHSFREFHGDMELPYPTDPSLYANTHVHGFDLSVIYQVTRRFSVTLGVKFPTGDDDATDIFHQPTGRVRRPVDPAIQPGDGGFGIVTELSAFQKIYHQLFAYAQGIYLINPRDSNHVQQPTGNEEFFTLGEFGYTFNSVPDQYLARAGLGCVVWPKYGLALSLGSRVEGVPVEDFIGDSHGWRNAGYAFYVEPGLLVSKGHFAFSITGPVAFHRHADKNLTDIKVSKEFHADIGGNAAFADYLITTSFSWWF